MHLLFSANRWFLAANIRQDLTLGINLIADRYSFSGIAYSLAKNLDKAWICMPEKGLPKPDIVLFLDTKPVITTTRSGFGDEVHEQGDFQQNVYEHMHEIFNETYWQVCHIWHKSYILKFSRLTLVERSRKCTKESPIKSTK